MSNNKNMLKYIEIFGGKAAKELISRELKWAHLWKKIHIYINHNYSCNNMQKKTHMMCSCLNAMEWTVNSPAMLKECMYGLFTVFIPELYSFVITAWDNQATVRWESETNSSLDINFINTTGTYIFNSEECINILFSDNSMPNFVVLFCINKQRLASSVLPSFIEVQWL